VIKGGFPVTTEATTINKVCASGLKTVSLGTQAIQTGDRDVILAGGMESMSNAPYLIARGLSYGNGELRDSIVRDGFLDAYDQIHMGLCCENTNKRDNITREQQDDFAIESYKRALAAQENGGFDAEIVPVVIKSKKGEVVVDKDESPKGINFDKVRGLRPAFAKDGTVTAANASSINDGAAALVLASGDKATELGANVVARVVSYADASKEPIDFTIAPSFAIPRALERAGLKVEDIAKWEINEAFSGVSITNNRRLNLDPAKVNVKGGAVALGHPIGASGARILVTLIHNLKDGEYGVAAICNGGGGATALVIQKTSSVDTPSKL
jgi:acetyl-CoA C-acetyltransferase